MNKRLLAIFCLCALSVLPAIAQSTTTITGNIKNLGTGSVSSGTFVRFYLRGCTGNLPRINGTAIIAPTLGNVYYFDFVPNGSGAISGTLYSTRDSTGLLAGAIECGGSKTAVWYGMVPFLNGKGGPETPIHAKASATIDISNVTPIVTNPVITAPTGDSTYLRLDAGNSPVTAPLTVTGSLTTGSFISSTSNPAATGESRLASGDTINWRNNANGADVSLAKTGAASGGLPADSLDTTAFGSVVTPVLNNIQTVTSKTSGTDICAKIVTGITALPATGGTVDAKSFQGVQACASNPLASLSKPVQILLGNVTIQTSVMWQHNTGNIPLVIQGMGMCQTNTANNCTFLQYTAAGAVAAVLNIGTATPQTVFIAQLHISDMSIGGNANVTDAFFITGVNHSQFVRLDLRDVTGACFHSKFAVVDTLQNIHCTNGTRAFATTPTNCLLLEETAAGFPTTAMTVIDPICESVSGSGIKLNGALSSTFTSGTSESNTTRNIEVTSNSDNHNNTFIGIDQEGCSGCVEDTLEGGTNDLYLNVTATTKLHITSTAKNVKIIGGGYNNVTIDAGAVNTYFDAPWNNSGVATFVDNGTATRFGRVINTNGNVVNGEPFVYRDTIPTSNAGGIDPQDFLGSYYSFSTTPVVLSNTVLTASAPWRAVFLGVWENGVEGTTLAQPAPYQEVTSAANTLAIGSVTLTVSLNGSNQLQAVTGSNTVAFAGRVIVFSNGPSTAGTSSIRVKGSIQAPTFSTTNLLISSTAPTIAAAGCGGSAASIVANNGTGAFEVNVGSAPTSGGCTITMPSATTGWNCDCSDLTTTSTTVFYCKQTGAVSQTSVVLQNFSDVAAATAFTASDHLRVKCAAY